MPVALFLHANKLAQTHLHQPPSSSCCYSGAIRTAGLAGLCDCGENARDFCRSGMCKRASLWIYANMFMFSHVCVCGRMWGMIALWGGRMMEYLKKWIISRQLDFPPPLCLSQRLLGSPSTQKLRKNIDCRTLQSAPTELGQNGKGAC